MSNKKIDLSKPQFDQELYLGRAKHFFKLTNPFNCLATDEQLEEAKRVVTKYKKDGYMPEGYTEEKLWAQKYLHDSAFHPDTGEKMFILGRMSAQVPMNTLITGGMVSFYSTTAQTVFFQWINQTFNAAVNYTNRSGDAPISRTRLIASYLCACGGALGTALFLNSKAKSMPSIFGRLVPFAAVCGANFINIPMMRSLELTNGTPVFTRDGQKIGDSVSAARKGIFLVCISRVIMAVPGMTLTPFLMSILERRKVWCRHPRLEVPFQIFMVGLCVTFATPLCCALFKQQAAISLESMEPHLQEKAKSVAPKEKEFFFNKGL